MLRKVFEEAGLGTLVTRRLTGNGFVMIVNPTKQSDEIAFVFNEENKLESIKVIDY